MLSFNTMKTRIFWIFVFCLILGVFITASYAAPVPVTKYKVTFNSNGGSPRPSVEVESGKKIPEPPKPTRAGYTFNGWYSNSTLSIKWNFVTDTVTGSITLYAKWNSNKSDVDDDDDDNDGDDINSDNDDDIINDNNISKDNNTNDDRNYNITPSLNLSGCSAGGVTLMGLLLFTFFIPKRRR